MSELSQDDLNHFNEHLTSLADDAGFELDDADRMRLFQLSQEGGFNPEATEAAFDDLYGDFDDADDDEPLTRAEFEEYAQGLEQQHTVVDDEDEDGLTPGTRRLVDDAKSDIGRLQAKLGRPLLGREIDAIASGVLEQANRTGQIDVEAAAGPAKSFSEMSREEANAHMVARVRDLDPPEERDPDRAFDLSNHDDFMDYAKLRVEGAAAEDFTDVYADDDSEAA